MRYSVPDGVEAPYLSKAKHVWNPDWCPGDLFLDSANVHIVYYATLGWLTRWLTLTQTAWLGRCVALFLLALGWTGFLSRIVPGQWGPLWTAWVYLAFAAVGNLAGEWIVGGVEGKVFAYVFVFAALSLLFAERTILAALCAGLAISFHPVVGVWSVACAAFAGLIGFARQRFRRESVPRPLLLRPKLMLPLCVLILAALPGLVPAVSLLGEGSEAEAVLADSIQVLYRLPHHLDPRSFPLSAYGGYAVLTCIWLIGARRAAQDWRTLFFHRFVLGAMLIFAAGLVIGLPPLTPAGELSSLRLKLLKFYPFRLADAMLPIAAAAAIVGWAASRLSEDQLAPRRRQQSAIACWALAGSAMVFSLLYPSAYRNPSRLPADRLADWEEACRWIADHTPRDSLFFTPDQSWAFKWYAQRAEFVSYKDCPQDPPRLVEWRRRLTWMQQWKQETEQNGVSLAALECLREETGVSHLISRQPATRVHVPIYENQSYCVYRLSRQQ